MIKYFYFKIINAVLLNLRILKNTRIIDIYNSRSLYPVVVVVVLATKHQKKEKNRLGLFCLKKKDIKYYVFRISNLFFFGTTTQFK